MSNPLKNFFRGIKTYIPLPSGRDRYPPGVVDLTETGELGIMPMTGQDELTLKNPDALLNGEALVSVILSCAPGVRHPQALLSNDIDAIITAIRSVTYGDDLESEITCPKCGESNLYQLDLAGALADMTYLDPEYPVEVDSGLTIYLRPYTFPEVVRGLHTQFDQARLSRAIGDQNSSEEERSRAIGQALKNMSQVTFELAASSIERITTPTGETVTDRNFIREYLANADRGVTDRLKTVIQRINEIGVRRTFSATCQSCQHQWTSEMEMNPVNFS